MIDDYAKGYLRDALGWNREALVWKLEGLSEYDLRRPLTNTGTNLLGLVKHLAFSGARYFGEVFDRPFPDTVPRWDDDAAWTNELWAREDETKESVLDLYLRVWEHSNATFDALPIDAPGLVPWWTRPNVKLFNIMIHMLNETNRHLGHADILREQIDGAVGVHPAVVAPVDESDRSLLEVRFDQIERIARATDVRKSEP